MTYMTHMQSLNPDWSVSPVGDHNSKRKIKREKFCGDMAQRHETDLVYKKDREPKLAEFLRKQIIEEEFAEIKKRNGWI